MKRFFTLTLLMAFGLALVGAPLDEATAKQFAQNFWKKNNTMGVRDGKVYRNKTDDAHFVNIAPQLGYSELFIFNNVEGKGFVIMAADDCVTPILGYSYENNITDGTLPPNLKAWLDGYAEEIRAAVAMKATATDEIRADWASLKQGKPLPIKSENDVNHLVQTNWDQSPYYNDQCPYDNNDHSRTLTGCVATAMAQVMKFWNYPEHGLGSHSYVPSSHPEYGTLYVDFSAVNYQWSAMPNVVNSANSAVATLMYHCGVAVDMMYGISGAPDYGSAAYIIDYGGDRPCAETALKTYFNYKSTLHGVEKNNYTDSQWIALLKGELDNSRPMVYGGFSNSGGHAFVCDGYDYRDYFHFNWGWGGYYNGNFYINDLNPGTHNYSRNQQAIVGIEDAFSLCIDFGVPFWTRRCLRYPGHIESVQAHLDRRAGLYCNSCCNIRQIPPAWCAAGMYPFWTVLRLEGRSWWIIWRQYADSFYDPLCSDGHSASIVRGKRTCSVCKRKTFC